MTVVLLLFLLLACRRAGRELPPQNAESSSEGDIELGS